MDRHLLTPGQIAARTGLTVSALHFYERKGLIASSRNTGNQRRYGTDVIRRVSVIKAAQQLGVSLAEIQQAFERLPRHKAPNKRDWEQLAQRWHHQLEQRVRKLQLLKESLTGCIGCGCLSMETCPLYNPEDILGENHVGPAILDAMT